MIVAGGCWAHGDTLSSQASFSLRLNCPKSGFTLRTQSRWDRKDLKKQTQTRSRPPATKSISKPANILPIVVDAWNQGWDAVRYSLDGYIQRRGSNSVWAKLAQSFALSARHVLLAGEHHRAQNRVHATDVAFAQRFKPVENVGIKPNGRELLFSCCAKGCGACGR